MSFRVHSRNPASAVEAAHSRIYLQRMAEVPILNAALSVEAVGFQRWQVHWLGIVVTPWCMSVLLVPGSSDNWVSAGQNKRRFIKFPCGELAFLGSDEDELGEFQSCSLFSPMGHFTSQAQAILTAKASMLGLLTGPRPTVGPPKTGRPADEPALSRRGFLALKPQQARR